MVAASPRKLRPATGWQMAAWLSICPDEPCAQGWTCWPRWKRNAGPEAVQQQTAARPSAQSTLPINVLPRTPAGSPPQPGLAECNPICRPVSAQLSNVAMYPKHLPLVQDRGAPGLPTNLSGGRAAATFLETTRSQSHPHHHHHHHHHYPPPGPHQQPPLHPAFLTPPRPPWPSTSCPWPRLLPATPRPDSRGIIPYRPSPCHSYCSCDRASHGKNNTLK